MSFKARLGTPLAMTADNGKFRTWTSRVSYRFTKNKIHLPSNIITVFNPDNIIYDQSKYILLKLEKDSEFYTRDSKFQAKFEDGVVVNLVTNWYQLWGLRFTHKLTILQNEKRYIATTIIGLLTSIITYFIGQFVGFRSGFQDGLREGKTEDKEVNIKETKAKDQLNALDSPKNYREPNPDSTKAPK